MFAGPPDCTVYVYQPISSKLNTWLNINESLLQFDNDQNPCGITGVMALCFLKYTEISCFRTLQSVFINRFQPNLIHGFILTLLKFDNDQNLLDITGVMALCSHAHGGGYIFGRVTMVTRSYVITKVSPRSAVLRLSPVLPSHLNENFHSCPAQSH